ncbi:MAG: type II secretion system F family protein [Phycisphaerales bacterium]|nr:MAG: type II secretion system F family protein [Phycisphaerales bacterium]
MPTVESDFVTKPNVSERRAGASAEGNDAESTSRVRDTLRRVGTRNICTVTRQLATMLRAGMPLTPALSAITEQLLDGPEGAGPGRSQKNPLAEVMRQVHDSVNAGGSLAEALGEHPNVFSPLYVNMVAAGQTGGTLEEILLRLAEILENRVRLASKVKAAVAYPLMMAVVATAVVGFLMSYVVPSITQIFLEMNRALPWPTRLLISVSTFTRTYLAVIAVAVCAAIFTIVAGYRTKQGRFFADRYKLRLPLFGNLLVKLEIARLTRTLGMLLASGIPILQALQITKGIVVNSFIADALGSVKESVGKGGTVANSIRKTGLFPPIVCHIVETSQISGRIEEGLIDIADMYENEVETTTKTLTSLLEPMILLVMGALVGFIVLAILLPIFEINQAI